jgi:hypothetical protein
LVGLWFGTVATTLSKYLRLLVHQVKMSGYERLTPGIFGGTL